MTVNGSGCIFHANSAECRRSSKTLVAKNSHVKQDSTEQQADVSSLIHAVRIQPLLANGCLTKEDTVQSYT